MAPKEDNAKKAFTTAECHAIAYIMGKVKTNTTEAKDFHTDAVARGLHVPQFKTLSTSDKFSLVPDLTVRSHLRHRTNGREYIAKDNWVEVALSLIDKYGATSENALKEAFKKENLFTNFSEMTKELFKHDILTYQGVKSSSSLALTAPARHVGDAVAVSETVAVGDTIAVGDAAAGGNRIEVAVTDRNGSTFPDIMPSLVRGGANVAINYYDQRGQTVDKRVDQRTINHDQSTHTHTHSTTNNNAAAVDKVQIDRMEDTLDRTYQSVKKPARQKSSTPAERSYTQANSISNKSQRSPLTSKSLFPEESSKKTAAVAEPTNKGKNDVYQTPVESSKKASPSDGNDDDDDDSIEECFTDYATLSSKEKHHHSQNMKKSSLSLANSSSKESQRSRLPSKVRFQGECPEEGTAVAETTNKGKNDVHQIPLESSNKARRIDGSDDDDDNDVIGCCIDYPASSPKEKHHHFQKTNGENKFSLRHLAHSSSTNPHTPLLKEKHCRSQNFNNANQIILYDPPQNSSCYEMLDEKYHSRLRLYKDNTIAGMAELPSAILKRCPGLHLVPNIELLMEDPKNNLPRLVKCESLYTEKHFFTSFVKHGRSGHKVPSILFTEDFVVIAIDKKVKNGNSFFEKDLFDPLDPDYNNLISNAFPACGYHCRFKNILEFKDGRKISFIILCEEANYVAACVSPIISILEEIGVPADLKSHYWESSNSESAPCPFGSSQLQNVFNWGERFAFEQIDFAKSQQRNLFSPIENDVDVTYNRCRFAGKGVCLVTTDSNKGRHYHLTLNCENQKLDICPKLVELIEQDKVRSLTIKNLLITTTDDAEAARAIFDAATNKKWTPEIQDVLFTPDVLGYDAGSRQVESYFRRGQDHIIPKRKSGMAPTANTLLPSNEAAVVEPSNGATNTGSPALNDAGTSTCNSDLQEDFLGKRVRIVKRNWIGHVGEVKKSTPCFVYVQNGDGNKQVKVSKGSIEIIQDV